MASTSEVFAANLRRYRLAAGLSQEALADAADLHINAVGLLERGQRDPRLSTLAALAYALSTAPSASTARRQPVSVADLTSGVEASPS